MRLTTNDKLIERQSKIARYATFGGLAVLLGALVTTFTRDISKDTNALIIAYAMLFVGFILAYVGAVLGNKYIREPRADRALEKALKGFDNKNHLYNFVLPLPHVLLTPSGIVILKVKSSGGSVTCKGDKWSGDAWWKRLIGGMGQEPLGNPSQELRGDIAAMKEWLASKMENAALVPVDGYVVFSDPRVQLSVEEASAPVARAGELKDVMRKGRRGAPLAPQLYEQVHRILDDEANAKAAQ
jgi:hypothetical protein